MQQRSWVASFVDTATKPFCCGRIYFWFGRSLKLVPWLFGWLLDCSAGRSLLFWVRPLVRPWSRLTVRWCHWIARPAVGCYFGFGRLFCLDHDRPFVGCYFGFGWWFSGVALRRWFTNQPIVSWPFWFAVPFCLFIGSSNWWIVCSGGGCFSLICCCFWLVGPPTSTIRRSNKNKTLRGRSLVLILGSVVGCYFGFGRSAVLRSWFGSSPELLLGFDSTTHRSCC
jgi:hypothetical protein